jgi:hypothetical protein
MSQKISLGNEVVNFAFLGDIEVNPNSLCEDQTIPNQVYASTCNRSSFTYNVTGATSGTTYIWGRPTFPLSGSAQSVPQNNFSQGNISVIGNLNAMTPQTGSFSLTGITNGVCSSNPFNVTVYVAPKPYITNKTTSINTDFYTSGATFNVVPVYDNATNNVVPSGTTYTWTTTAVSGITGNTNQVIPQTGISQTLITSLITPVNVVYTVTPSTSFYGTTCVGDPFTVTVTVNPRPFLVRYTYNANSSKDAIYTTSNLTFSWDGVSYGGVVINGWRYTTTRSQDILIPYNLAGANQLIPRRNICVSTVFPGGNGTLSWHQIRVLRNGVQIFTNNYPNLGTVPTCPTQISTTRNLGTFTFNPGDTVQLIWGDEIT